jgi:hypothetical protein
MTKMNYSVQKSDFISIFSLQHLLVGLKMIEIENIIKILLPQNVFDSKKGRDLKSVQGFV